MLRLAVAASGGADSIALLLEASKCFLPREIIVLSIDHQTRASSAFERAHAGRTADQFGFRFHELTIGAVGANQAAWRDARLSALLRFCEAASISTLWLGHHRDDAVETAAIRLIAGGPLHSVGGISSQRSVGQVTIERPLLKRSARDVRRSLMVAGLGWAEDPSNHNVGYTRVAVRKTLAIRVDKSAKELLRKVGSWRSARDQLTDEAWYMVRRSQPDELLSGAVHLRASVMRDLPPKLAAIVLRRAARTVVGRGQRLRRVNFLAVATVGGPTQMGGAISLPHDADWLVCRDYRHIRDDLLLPTSGTVEWDARYCFSVCSHLPPGRWRIARLGIRAAKGLSAQALQLPLPPEYLASLPAVWVDDCLVGVPSLDFWQGKHSSMLHQKLRWQLTAIDQFERFQLAP